MILNQETTKCETNMSGATAFTIQANAKMFKILSSGLYSNKERAIIREVSCNAYDANVDAGNREIPIVVHLPNDLEPYFSIKDSGTGLTPDQMVNIYTQYGNSTKTNRNDQIGALGLGSKSPFSYIDSFTVISITRKPKYVRKIKEELELFDINNPDHFNSDLYEVVEHSDIGLKSTYSCYIDGSGEPKLQPFGSEETEEMNGVEVRFPVKAEDFNQFREEAEIVYRPFEVKPEVKGNANYEVKSFKILLESEVEKDWELVDPISKTWNRDQIRVAVQGNIEYPINTDKISEHLSKNARTFLYENFRLYFNIGDLDIAASREELGYDKETIANIVTKFEKMTSEIIEAQNKKINSFETRYEAMQYIADISSISEIYRNFTFTYKGNALVTQISFKPDDYEVVKYSTNGRIIRREVQKNNWGNTHSFNILTSKNKVIFVLADETSNNKSVKKARTLVEFGNSVYLVQDEEFLDLIGNPEFIRATDIELEKTTKSKGKHFKTFYPTSEISNQYRNAYDSADRLGIDLSEEFFYTEIQGKTPTNGINIYDYYITAKNLGLLPDNFRIIGISSSYTKTKAYKEFKDNGIEIYEYLKNLLTNSSELLEKIEEIHEFRESEIINNMNNNYRKVLDNNKILSELPQDHILNVAKDSVKEYDYSKKEELREYRTIMIGLGIYEENKDLVKYDSIIEESYPLIYELGWSFSSMAVLDYIKGQDLLKKLYSAESSANTTESEKTKEA